MYSPLSDRFITAIRESGKRKTVVDAWYANELVAADLPVSEGSIRVELEGQVRRSGSITIADPGLVSSRLTAVSPHGTELLVRQGVVYPDGTEELIPIGRFRIEISGWRDLENIPRIQMYDRSKALQVQLPSSYGAPGRRASDVIVEILHYFYPSLAPISHAALFAPGLTDYRLPGGHVFDQGTYWDAISDLAKNMGGRLYFDVTGTPVCTPLGSLSAGLTPSLEIAVGEQGVLVEANHEYSREGVFNAVTVRGAAAQNGFIPVYTAFNTALDSPLRWDGPFGRVRDEIEDSSIVSSAQAQLRARAELSKYTGLSYSLDFDAVPNPAYDAGDVVRFRFSSGEAQIHELSTLSIPLGKGRFTGTSKGGYQNG